MSRRFRAHARPLAVENLENRRLFAVSYTVTDLAPDVGGIVHTGRAYGMSNNGRVAMQYDGHAAVWFNGAVKDLGFAGYATDVNDNGVVCGVDTSEGSNRPFVYKEGVKTILSLEGTTNGVANAVNAAGTVVGTINLGGTTRGFYAELGGAAHGIGLPTGASAVQATGINDSGQIVGNLQNASGANRAFIKSGGTFKLITNLPGGEISYIDHGLTNSGTLAVDGPSNDTVPGTNVKADRVYTVGSNGYGAPVGRGTLGVATHIHATDINAGGVVVADVPDPGTADSFAVRNLAGVGFDRLDSLVNAQLGWHFATAGAVNDAGAIVGTGSQGGGDVSPYLLTPIPAATAKINGRVFNDVDNDGVRDVGEGNLSGVKVTISKDGVVLNTLTTGTSGEFSFTGLEAGTYVLAQTVLPGYTATAPATGTFTVTVANGQTVGEKFFGQHKNEEPVQKYQIRGKVWNDTDNDGVFDSNEVVSGVRTVYIDANRNGKLDAGEKSTQSKENGEYVLEGLTNGEYAVSRVLPDGYHLSNGTNGKSWVIVNVNGANVLGVNLGSAANVVAPKTASITGVVFNDTDKDGIWDDGEERSGVRTVFIDANGNKTLDEGEVRVQSNSEGRYTFSGLAAGTYRITRVFPSGYKLSNNNDGYVTITVTAGQVKTGVNLGSRPV